ncbi:hypothetical protein N7532_000157 [Penicillium argentinense]|uniref:DUF2293 domain-containing protein n=1 Tax=Penicillium argentinense TaxID=1131581 RepID=A0A9W9KNL1_9EURO|nr:uncharacterized protein N7532_000157 [Penicillium argentinense]KAJ5112112.1 hypothetical protein N7532_000157 [Penicillium argentinense]
MARVKNRTASSAASTRHSPGRAVTERKARKHQAFWKGYLKPVKEHRLASSIYLDVEPPANYTFVASGTPLLTKTCKNRCRAEGSRIFAVSTSHDNPNFALTRLSIQVHRVGYHFPTAVVNRVCYDLGLYLTDSGKAVPLNTPTALEELSDTDKDQVTLNTEARDTIQDMFPNIPADDLNQIIKRSFQKGGGKIGTAFEHSLNRRVHLAVVAHIRHTYTDYDWILENQYEWVDARKVTEQPTLAKLMEWRGNDENGRENSFEDAWSEDSLEEALRELNNRDVETHDQRERQNPIEPDKIQPRPINANVDRLDPKRKPSEEAPSEFQFVSKKPTKTGDRRGFYRYQACMDAPASNSTVVGNIDQSRIDRRHPAIPEPERTHSTGYRELTLQTAEVASGIASNCGRVRPLSPGAPSLAITQGGQGPVLLVDTQDKRAPWEGQQRALSHQYHFGSSGRLALTTQESTTGGTYNFADSHLLTRSPRASWNLLPSAPRSNAVPHARTEWVPTALSGHGAGAPVSASGHQEQFLTREGQFRPCSEGANPPQSRPGSNLHTQDRPLPSIETAHPGRGLEDRVTPSMKRMALRTVTPECLPSSRAGSPDPKRRRLAYPPQGSDDLSFSHLRQDLHSEPRIARPMGPVSYPDGPPFEYRVQNGQYVKIPRWKPVDEFHEVVRPDYLLTTVPSTVYEEKSGKYRPYPAPGTNEFISNNRSSGPPPGVSRLGPSGPAYSGDNGQGRIPIPRTSHALEFGGLPASSTASDGRLYADGFVRSIGFHEVPPVGYVQRPRAQQRIREIPAPGNFDQSTWTKIPDPVVSNSPSVSREIYAEQTSSVQFQPPASFVGSRTRDPISHVSDPVSDDPQSRGPPRPFMEAPEAGSARCGKIGPANSHPSISQWELLSDLSLRLTSTQ